MTMTKKGHHIFEQKNTVRQRDTIVTAASDSNASDARQCSVCRPHSDLVIGGVVERYSKR